MGDSEGAWYLTVMWSFKNAAWRMENFISVRCKVSLRRVRNLFCHSPSGTDSGQWITKKILKRFRSHVQQKKEEEKCWAMRFRVGKTDFLKALNYLRKKLDSLCLGHKGDPPPPPYQGICKIRFQDWVEGTSDAG